MRILSLGRSVCKGKGNQKREEVTPMYGSELNVFSFWWIFPLLMMALCFFLMRGRWHSMMCCPGTRGGDRQPTKGGESAVDILDRRYASGEIDKAEYEEKKQTIACPTDPKTD
jgi:uncharacterized membrane protein